MLPPDELTSIVDTMLPILDNLNEWITKDLIRRLMIRLERGEDSLFTGTDRWQLEVYKSAGGHYEALQREIKRFTKQSDEEVRKIFEDAGIKAWNWDNAFYISQGLDGEDFGLSERMVQILTDSYKRTNGEIHNFTRTIAKASQKRFIKVLDSAHIKVMSGAQSYTSAVSEAVNELATEQTKVYYPSGHVDTIETAVLRAVRTGTAQASGNIALQGMVERDWDLIRVSAHLGARYGDGGENPGNHFWWQGKLYSRTGRTPGYLLFEEATGYGTGEGLSGYNCRHNFGPGDPEHNPFKEYDSQANKEAYDLAQKQRAAEARIRRSKCKLIGIKEALKNTKDEEIQAALTDSYNKTALTLKKQNARYNSFCEENKLKPYPERLSVAKWTRSEASKATAAAIKAEKNKQ